MKSPWFDHIMTLVYQSETGKELVSTADYTTLPIPVINQENVFLAISFCKQDSLSDNQMPLLFSPKATVYVSPTDYELTWRQHLPSHFGLTPTANNELGVPDRSHIHSVKEWDVIENVFYENLLDLVANDWLLGKKPNLAFEKRVAFDLRGSLTILEDDVLAPYYQHIRHDLNLWIKRVLG
jgi:hypothetical protein